MQILRPLVVELLFTLTAMVALTRSNGDNIAVVDVPTAFADMLLAVSTTVKAL
jgi:hypothetical protein